MPWEIFGPTGYLPKRQSNIQSLSLITSTACLEDEDDMEPILLNGFNKIRKFYGNASDRLGSIDPTRPPSYEFRFA